MPTLPTDRPAGIVTVRPGCSAKDRLGLSFTILEGIGPFGSGVDPNGKYDGYTYPLIFYAVGTGGGPECMRALQVFLDAGGDVTQMEQGNSVFVFVALHQENPDIVEMLVSLGASPCHEVSGDIAAHYGETSLVDLARQETVPSVVMALEDAVEKCA
ncbi:MAG: hypothetical protein GY926_01760 [bacterium]|nr:hypothetical protein [bacterium]